MSIVVKGAWVPLYDRARTIITSHYDVLADADRDYLVSLYARKIVWGTNYQLKRINQIEAALNNQPA